MKTSWYYYLHTNGNLIYRNPAVVDSDPDYFDSPFVKKVWKINAENREDAWTMILEALVLGARIESVQNLAGIWKLTFEDSIEMIQRIKPDENLKKGFEMFLSKILNLTWDQYETKARLDKAYEKRCKQEEEFMKIGNLESFRK